MKYQKALQILHRTINPDRYVEIGVAKGLSLNLAECKSIGIDPSPQVSVEGDNRKNIYKETSDDFFSKYNLTELLDGAFDLAFIDGMHQVEYALRDFINVERQSRMGSYIIIDDILPEDIAWTTREREGRVWTGDVYRLIYILKKYRPDLDINIFDVELKGMAIITNLNPDSSILEEKYDEIIQAIKNGEYVVNNIDTLKDSFKPKSTSILQEWITRKEGEADKREYLELLKSCLNNKIYADNDLRLIYLMECLQKERRFNFEEFHDIIHKLPDEYQKLIAAKNLGQHYDRSVKKAGFAHTMIGSKRMGNLVSCMDIIRKNNIEGDFIECGVWRGGACILMAGYNKMYKLNKKVYVADSFRGLPESTYKQDLHLDLSSKKFPELAVSANVVKENFRKYNLLSENIVFLEGWFKDTLFGLEQDLKISLLRMDGDLYESTINILDALYDKVVPGGIIIVDDFAIKACKQAVFDFFNKRKIDPPDFKKIDWTGIFWIKE